MVVAERWRHLSFDASREFLSRWWLAAAAPAPKPLDPFGERGLRGKVQLPHGSGSAGSESCSTWIFVSSLLLLAFCAAAALALWLLGRAKRAGSASPASEDAPLNKGPARAEVPREVAKNQDPPAASNLLSSMAFWRSNDGKAAESAGTTGADDYVFGDSRPVTVKVVSAKGLRNADPIGFGKSDPYCICQVVGKPKAMFETSTIKDSLDPTWEHESELSAFCVGDSLEFSIYDKDAFPKKDELLGKVAVPYHLFQNGFRGDLELADPGGLGNAGPSVRLEISFADMARQQAEPKQQEAKPQSLLSMAGPSWLTGGLRQAPSETTPRPADGELSARWVEEAKKGMPSISPAQQTQLESITKQGRVELDSFTRELRLKKGIEFDSDPLRFKNDAEVQATLKDAAEVMKTLSTTVWCIEGHSEQRFGKLERGAHEVSLGHAELVKKSLIAFGIDAGRLQTLGLPGNKGNNKEGIVLRITSY
eukprot:TRINITY_DN46933_c0_g1_i1.p1 TRINITY_DN46933_c0_g1~~TRINITY_DN46933_c0_g1_i1.p1  ORF type:complete len:479 (-),score=115.97 TRINITY_DN46933_c0_g1_i1:88-1524(-)